MNELLVKFKEYDQAPVNWIMQTPQPIGSQKDIEGLKLVTYLDNLWSPGHIEFK